MATTSTGLIPETVLEAFRTRAAGYDRDNRFFQEDFDDLQANGYLRMAVPREFGGLGFTLAEVARETRRVAMYAPPTALGTNMHNYWVGLCADLWRQGDRSIEWLLQEAGAGEVFAAGHAETGNDLPLLLSTTTAKKVDGGWTFTGRKAFGSLTPVWTRLGIHGMDASDPSAPKIVHAFVPRGSKGLTIEETWDALGMRATRSDDTILDGVVVPDRYVARVVPAGAAGLDAFVRGVFAWALLGFANVYYALARRALDLTVERLRKKTSLAVSRGMAHHPEVQHTIARMVLELEAIEPHIERIAQDWSDGVDHGPAWPSKLVAAKYRAVEGAWKVVDLALEVAGGFGVFRVAGLERLLRDARLGRIHPANSFLTHEIVAKTALGIDLDEVPRWG
jgi:alkylation response protein AidB-like acyl-CoA dehydrogenase